MKTSLRSMACLWTALLCGVCWADEKSDLYQKGQEAVMRGDAIAASDAFCALPYKYKDAAAQCATYRPLADKTLFRYKQNYADGVSAMQAGDYSTAEIKFRFVKGGPYADQAKEKMTEMRELKARAAADEQARVVAAARTLAKEELDQEMVSTGKRAMAQTMHVGESGKAFQSACGQNTQFEEQAFAGRDMQSFFCAGWVQGVTEELAARHVVCLPPTLGVSQQTALLVNYMRQHTEEIEQPSSVLLEKALREQYSCGAQSAAAVTR